MDKNAAPLWTLHLLPGDVRGFDSMLGFDYGSQDAQREERVIRQVLRRVDDRTDTVTVTPEEARILAEWKAISRDEYDPARDDFEADPRAVAKILQEWRKPSRRASEGNKIPGGLSDKKEPKDFDSRAVAKGQRVEMEHTDDPALAREIARDHLIEDPGYYDKLERMEAGACARVAARYVARQAQ
jgi:hypothetical protein